MAAVLLRVLAVLTSGLCGLAQAISVASVTPQGEVAQVRQVVVRFDRAVVAFGDLRLPDPMAVACEAGTPAGAGRWANDRTWLFDFQQALPPGLRCTVKLRPAWRPLPTSAEAAGSAPVLSGRTDFSFSTGGPAVVRVLPYEGSEIEESQYFLLRLNGPVADASLAQNAWCEVEGIGERLPALVIDGAPRTEIIKARKLQAQAANLVLLSCQRPMANDTRMRLVWGAGMASKLNPQVVTRQSQVFEFKVRPAFTAEFSCERERASAPCLPIRPMTLSFTEPVARTLALQVRLRPANANASSNALAPVLDKDNKSTELSQISFPHPMPENAKFTVELPLGLQDSAGRTLANAGSFPMQVATGASPALAKFATAPFAVIEHGEETLLPVTLRHVQPDLRPAASQGQVRIRRIDGAADILAWLGKVKRFHETQVTAQEAGLPKSAWTETQTDTDSRGRTVRRQVQRWVGSREVSLLKADAGARRLDLPQLQGGDPRPFEVVGIPITQPGYHVVEIESARLGASLLDPPAPMFVRTGVLVTNLGVHFKHGRDNSLVWVTTLDRGKPVPGAGVTVHDCHGKVLWTGNTDNNGLARTEQPLAPDNRDCPAEEGLFVTATKAGAKAGTDVAFVFSTWQQGIEPWRFNVPTGSPWMPSADAAIRAHTVFDRTLLRAGEAVAMKHFMRHETLQGLAALKPEELPTTLTIVHQGSNQRFTQPLQWAGTRQAQNTWDIPPSARLGVYRVSLERPGQKAGELSSWDSGEFRVEAFRVPLLEARLVPPKDAPVAPKDMTLGVQLNYLSGGARAQAPLRGTAVLMPRTPRFPRYDEFSFAQPQDAGPEPQAQLETDSDGSESAAGTSDPTVKLVADKVPLTTDSNGAASWRLSPLPALTQPGTLQAEISFTDPNGEVQSVATAVPLWPSAVVLGIKTGSWASERGKTSFNVLALDTNGQPLKAQPVQVIGRVAQTISTRKRLVGGFYAYDNRTEMQDLGTLCRGNTDDRGMLVCQAKLDTAGQVELVAQAQDAAGNRAQAVASIWVTQQGELWFAQDNDDRIDVLPEKKRYEPGETARLQVRMPFREATALVSVEREGVLDTRVVTLRGLDPTVEVPIDKAWGPNVYVSVMVVRGRIRHVPWTSFFTWGWKEPLTWARTYWVEGRRYQAPTALVDLSKPAFKVGVAALKVGLAAHELQVQVSTDKPEYTIRQKAMVRIAVTQGGQPARGAEVAFAAVDEGLLALRGNGSWDLLNAMLQSRDWSVETSTAQGEIVGRRHYGRKAVAAGGGGGRGGTRELLDTLLLWRAVVPLDSNGQATVEVPLNDALTSFRLVAVADDGVMRFGTGSTSIRVTQDLQVLSGLPPLVRGGDQVQAVLTLRNTTERDMQVQATLAGTVNRGAGTDVTHRLLALPPQTLALPAGSAREVVFAVDIPVGAHSVAWQAGVQEQGSGASKPGSEPAQDQLKVLQLVQPAVPERVLQATLQRLDQTFTLPVQAPADALAADGAKDGNKAGGLTVGLQPRLSGALPGIRRFFQNYPYSCLEQRASRALGLQDTALWATVANSLPTYLDADGLAHYYPPRAEDQPGGSDRLTAYILAAADEAGVQVPPGPREAMLQGLTAFVQGRIERRHWSPRPDLDVRKLAAIEALSRHGRAQAAMLGSIKITPEQWPTAALLDWVQILKRLPEVPRRDAQLAQAQQKLRARLTFAGTTLKFSNESDDFWWWLMDSADANAARLLLAVMDDPLWRDDLPRLVVGSLARQNGGAWLTTTANLWGALALNKFGAKFESQPVTGRTSAAVLAAGAASGADASSKPPVIDWRVTPQGGQLQLPWPAVPGSLTVKHTGSGAPWLTVQSRAAVPLTAPLSAGYTMTRTVSAVQQQTAGRWARGDIMRVRLELDAQTDMTWVVLSDPVPAGATILGTGLGRDSLLGTLNQRREGAAVPAYEERSFEAYRSVYRHLPRGKHVLEYSLRLNSAGRFGLPPTRVEAMYAPETFGELPNAPLEVVP